MLPSPNSVYMVAVCFLVEVGDVLVKREAAVLLESVDLITKYNKSGRISHGCTLTTLRILHHTRTPKYKDNM